MTSTLTPNLPPTDVFAIRDARQWDTMTATVTVTEIDGSVHSGYVTSWGDAQITLFDTTTNQNVMVITLWIAAITIA